MNEARGTVIELDGEYAWVRIDAAGCGHCHEAGGCGGQRKAITTKPEQIPTNNPSISPMYLILLYLLQAMRYLLAI